MRWALVALLALAAPAGAQIFPSDVGDKATEDNLYYLYELIQNNTSSQTISGSFIPLTASFGGDVSGTYNNLSVLDNSHNHSGSTVDLSTVTTALNDKVSKTGDTMTGPLVVLSSVTANTYYGDGSNLTGIDGVFEVTVYGDLTPSLTVTRDRFFEVLFGNIQPL